MKDIEDKLAAFLMDYGVLKNADAEKMAKRIAGMFAAERDQLAAKCAEMRGALKSITLIEWNEENAIDYWRQAHDIAILALSETK